MDPWGGAADTNLSRVESVGDSTETEEGFRDKFVDNFCENSDQITFEKLPDSEEYIKLLESKLQKLTSKRSNKSSEESKKVRQTLVEDLQKVREDALANFVTDCDTNNADSEADIDLERSVIVNPVIRRLVPEQPLTPGEQVVLTKADHLDIQSETLKTEDKEDPESL